ncbi:hypothetical protein ACSBR1_007723 [Camellia fascicularis]
MDPAVLDKIIERLIEVRSTKPGKLVQLSESEIKQLCVASRDIFIQQPNLLELEAPIKICEVAAFVFRSAATNSSCGFTAASSSLLLLFSNWITPYKTAICLYSAQFHKGFYAMDSH